jgi:hypothetical protein
MATTGAGMKRSGYAVAILLSIGVLVGCRASAPVGDTSRTAGPQAFCGQLLALNQMGAPERGGNRADELSELLAVADDRIADAVETFRDYHRDVYIDGDDTTDTYDSLPVDVREAVDRIDDYDERHC